MTYIEGRLLKEEKYWVLDAEPHVTVMFERLFPSAKAFYSTEAGLYKYTHRPRSIRDSDIVRKNIHWFIQRFNMDISKELRQLLTESSHRYDRQRERQSTIITSQGRIKLPLKLPLRKYQKIAVKLAIERKSLLVADQVGLGKTAIGIGIGSRYAPCLCIVPTHLVTQWGYEIQKFMPQAKVQKLKAGKMDVLPGKDFYVCPYSMISKYSGELVKRGMRSLILDEVHSLRHDGTLRYDGVLSLSDQAQVKVGLSATPIMNYGSDLHNIFEILAPGELQDYKSFAREWCDWGRIKDPDHLGDYLRKNNLMIRRTRKELKMELAPVDRQVITVDASLEELKKLEEENKMLALQIISGTYTDAGEAAREFDWKLRMATGVAKAKSVAELVKTYVESGEKVVLFGWHRDVYAIWQKELIECNPVMYTGTESTEEKESSLRRFIDGASKVFIISLRSGAGINGLQFASSTCVFGELDWSPGIIDQCIGRVWRDGQKEQVQAIFVTIEDGADPIMKEVIGKKSAEARAILDESQQELFASVGGMDRTIDLAREFLRRRGMDVDAIIEEREKERRGELEIEAPRQGDEVFAVFDAISRYTFNRTNEKALQESVASILQKLEVPFMKEARLSARSIVDFKLGNDVLIECKINDFSKRDMLRQIRRYKEDFPAKAILLVTNKPFKHFSLEGVPVYTINYSNNSLMMGGLG